MWGFFVSIIANRHNLHLDEVGMVYFTCVATNSAQRTSSFLPVDFSNSSVCSICRMPWAPKDKKKPYFTCVATNSAQRTSSFLPVDFSNSSIGFIQSTHWIPSKREKKNLTSPV
jgi:hypothetical protein